MRLSFCLALTLAAAAFPLVASADHHENHDSEEGFVPLIKNDSIDDWIQRGGTAEYKLEDGELVGTAVIKTPNSFLCPPDDVADFDLRFDFKLDKRLNSGVMFRAQSSDDYRDGRVHGYQCEHDVTERSYSAGIYDEARRGWLNDLKNNEAARKAHKPDDWNSIRIRCVGNHIRTWINGVPAAEVVDDVDASGFLGFQVHGINKFKEAPNPPMTVRWRNIRIKHLSPARPAPPKDAKK